MTTLNKTSNRWRGCLVLAVFGAVCFAVQGQLEAVVVSPSGDSSTTQGLAVQEPLGLPDLCDPTQCPSVTQPQAAQPYRAPPSYTQPGQQPGYSRPLPMPLPPTYTPGAPAGRPSAAAGALPTAPTAYGLYDSASNPSAGSAGFDRGFGLVGPGQGGASGGMGLGAFAPPAAPTPTASAGVTESSSAYGPYATSAAPQAPAQRQPASFGPSRYTTAKTKPFSNYRPGRVVSPYYSLYNNREAASRGINQYYTTVKPALDRQKQARQTSRDQALQMMNTRSDRGRGGNLIELKQRPGTMLQGSSPKQPATFMDLRQYYPAYR